MRKVSNRLLILVSCILLVLVTITPALAQNPITITFMGHGHPEEHEIFTRLIEKYEERYPHVTVNYINVPPAEYMIRLQAMVAGNQTPDVFYLPAGDLMPWADSGLLADLTELVANTDLFDEANIWPEALARYRYDGNMVGQGPLWALPKDVGPWALAYNADLFKEAGVPLPDPDVPWTWDEFLENARKLTRGSGNDRKWGAAFYTLEAAVWANGADWLDETKTRVTVDDSKFIEALQWVADLRLVHQVTPTREEEQSMGGYSRFINGQIAMFPMGPWDQPAFWRLPFEWDLMPWPVSPNTGKNATWIGSMGFAVSSRTKNLQEAFNLAAFLALDREGQQLNYELGMAVPNLIDMAETGFLNMDKPPANRKEFLRIITDYGRRPINEYTYDNEWIDAFWQGVDAVYAGRKTAAEFCKEIQPEMQSLLDGAIARQEQQRQRNR